jgi:hypothetical protein
MDFHQARLRFAFLAFGTQHLLDGVSKRNAHALIIYRARKLSGT